MNYRKLDANGDYTFGQGSGNFFTDSPEAVGQAVKTRLGLIEGEWFLDTSQGTPYNSRILGAGTVSQYDQAIQEVILNTNGVTRIVSYSSQVDSSSRAAGVNCTIDTIYGQTTLSTSL
jgi:hypothetical protein